MVLNTRAILKGVALAALAGTLAACAHKAPPPPPAPPPAPPPEAPPAPPPEAPPPPAPVGAVPGSVQDFIISAGDRVYFELNADNLGAEGRQVLDNQSQWLNRYPQVTVRIEGNCDERGTREYNLALGARRAEFIKTYLTQHGVAAGRITTISYGKERPIDSGTGDASWAKNRNGHTSITAGAVGGVNDTGQ